MKYQQEAGIFLNVRSDSASILVMHFSSSLLSSLSLLSSSPGFLSTLSLLLVSLSFSLSVLSFSVFV